MDYRITKSMQRKHASGGSKAPQSGESDDLTVLLRNTQSTHLATQAASIHALQSHIGNQAILRLIAPQPSSQRQRIQRQLTLAPTAEMEEEETEASEISNVAESPQVEAEEEANEQEQVEEQAHEQEQSAEQEQNDDPLKPVLQGSSNDYKAPEKAKKLSFGDRAVQFLPGGTAGEAKKSFKHAFKGAKKVRKQIKDINSSPKEVAKASGGVLDFLKGVIGSGIQPILQQAVSLITKALGDMSFIEQAIEFITTTLQPLCDTLSGIFETFMDVMEVVGDIVPIIGGAIQLGKAVISSIAGLINTIMRGMTALTLFKARKSDNEVVAGVAWYGFKKVMRSTLQRVYETGRSIGLVLRSATNIALDIAAFFSFGATEAGKIVTASLGVADSLIHTGERAARSIKGIAKAIKGSRGQGRLKNVTALVDEAIKGDSSAQDLIINLGAYSLPARINRSMAEGKLVLIDNIVQPIGNITGLNKTEASAITVAFSTWGKDKLGEFVDWLKSKYKSLKEKGLIKTVIDLLKDLLNMDKGNAKKMLQEDIVAYGGDKKHPWKRALILHLTPKLKSS